MPNLTRLSELQQKRRRIILGLMSGTSIDGLDLALCSFSGCGSDVKFEILHHGTKSYSDEQQYVLRMLGTQEMVRMEDVCIYHTELSRWHADIVLQALGEWGVDVSEVDLIASHGQTVRHAPKRIHGLVPGSKPPGSKPPSSESGVSASSSSTADSTVQMSPFKRS